MYDFTNLFYKQEKYFNMYTRNLIFFILFISFAFISCGKDDENSKEPQFTIIDPTQKVEGLTYKEILVETTKWWFSRDAMPGIQPLKNILILEGGSGINKRTLTIDREKTLFIPILMFTEWYYLTETCNPNFRPKNGESDTEFLGKIVDGGVKNMSCDFSLNGEKVITDLSKFLVKSDTFRFFVKPVLNPKDCTFSSQEVIAMSGGYSVAMRLKPGIHTIYYKGIACCPNFQSEMTWTITVN